MSNELAMFNGDQLPATQMGSSKSFKELARGGDYLKYVKLFTKGKPIDSGKIPPGHYGIPDNDDIIDLGTSIDIIPFAKRPKALDTSDKTATVTSYDAECEVFRDIAARSKIKDSGCQHGTSFLVWERSTAQFLELWFGNPSSRPEAKNVFDYCPLTPADYAAMEARGEDMTDVEVHGPRPLSMKVRLAENDKQQTWHVPQAAKCSAVFTKLPSVEEASAEIVRFMSVKSEGVEKVKEPEGNSKRKR